MKAKTENIQGIDPGIENEKFVHIFRHSPIAIELFDSNGYLLEVNKACLDLFGISSMDEVKGYNLFADPNLSQQTNFDIREGKSIKHEFEFNFELAKSNRLYETRREGICFLECYINPMTNESNEITGYIVHITERKKAENELIKSEEKFRKIVESSISGMYFYRLENNDRLIFIGANPAADRIIGISHQSLLGKTIEEAFPGMINTKFPALFKSIAKGESGPQEFEMEYNDELVSGHYSVQVFQTEPDTITVHFVDISEHKKAEILLDKQAKELQELNITKDKFLSIIAHDLKNPFGAIIGFSDLMLKKYYELDDETLLKGLRTIESASSHAHKLLENLLIWTQNQTGKRQFNPEILNLKTQVKESIRMIESTAIKKGISIVVKIKEALPVIADKNMIDSILRNLVSNAIKFSHKGGKVKVTVTEYDHELHISVTDHGVGISPERLSAIFEIDKRTHTAGTENEQGTGLGLILCKDFVTRHNGRIWAESTPGKGSIFTFSLPLNLP